MYGDPINGLDLTKQVALLYPSYFTLKRIIFVIVTLTLWHRPGIQLFIRLLAVLTSFTLLIETQPFADRIQNRLELLNEVVLVLIVDSLFAFTKVMNAGNPNDIDANGV